LSQTIIRKIVNEIFFFAKIELCESVVAVEKGARNSQIIEILFSFSLSLSLSYSGIYLCVCFSLALENIYLSEKLSTSKFNFWKIEKRTKKNKNKYKPNDF